jgi:predicted permease
MRRALVAGQFALATALVAGSGLLAVSLRNLQRVELGFTPGHLLLARVGIPQARYRTDQQRWDLLRKILDGMRNTPGVRAAATSSEAPLQGGTTAPDMFPVGASALGPSEQFIPDWRIVDADYFRTMGIPLKAGRYFTERDDAAAATIIVSESYANKLWPGPDAPASALGRQVHDQGNGVYTIVGVVGDVHNVSLSDTPAAINYFSVASVTNVPATVILRTDGDPLAMTKALREQVKRLDPVLPVFDVHSMDQLLSAYTAQARWNTWLVGSFAGLALVLGAVGIYGVLAYTVVQRRRELGVRLALGATPSDLIRLVIREGLALAATGIGFGTLLTLALGRLAASLLYRVDARDPLTLASVAAVLAMIALAASILPARRAARSDTISALRDS